MKTQRLFASILFVLILVLSNAQLDSSVKAQTTTPGQLLGTYKINYRDNAAGCYPPDWPNPTPIDGNPYFCPSSFPPGPYFIDAEPGKYRIVVTAVADVKSAHVWTGDATNGLRYSLELPVGSVVDIDHTHGQIVLYAWDWYVNDNSPDSFVEVALYRVAVDQTPPTVTCSVSPAQLWPPNHKLVPVTVSVPVADAESGPAGFTLLSVVSNESDNGLGDGDQPNDIQGFTLNSLDTSGQLRAERAGSGNGRIYTLTYQGADGAGNVATCAVKVTVPH